ncbi:gamma-glutamyltransferase 5a isoform X1 [Clarias gariepinus]|uniref:gamma-glutamyltransferase 5a isoform X1 n=2 Tax=Clarias gariepinus TaxID=13013 RepID=UPI00234E25CA|nr:gamma-glutamyltransferase 5a isoform X1 [Clarias gariepinus]
MSRKRKDRLRAGVCFAVIFIILILILIIVCTVKLPERRECKSGTYRRAGVASDSRTCSGIGRDILRAGGSAVDGAIAALICTSVINPQSMGLGGGVIFTIREKNGKVKIINARETTPKNVKADLLSKCSNSTGVHWVGVPGELRGYEHAHRLYGRLPWKHLFEPTIRLARDGVKISKLLSQYLVVLTGRNTALSRLFMRSDGTLMQEGDTVKFEKLADTLQKIAVGGADEFYSGDVAKALVRDVQEAGGSLTDEDLKSFQANETQAWSVSLDKYKMFFPPPPAGGAILSFILNIMEGYELNPKSIQSNKLVETYQRYVEACKFANGLKQFIKDPKFSSDKEARDLIKVEFADHVRGMITNAKTHDAQYYNVTPHPDTQGTTHISVLAEDGTAVSVTSTINHIFGSGVLSVNTGIILNNELADFCGRTKHIHPGERPPSSMTPVVLYSASDDHTLVIGASGGSMITTGMATVLMNYLWLGKTLRESIASPVVYVDGKNELAFEKTFDQNVISSLQEYGHTVTSRQHFYNTVNAVSKHEDECVNAISDRRKMGEPAGY